MAENIHLEVVTPENIVVDTNVQIVMAPGSMGEFGILSGHTPFLSTLNIGTLHYKDEKGLENSVFINGGFAEALPDKLTVLTESAEIGSEIDKDRVLAAQKRAEARLAEVEQGKEHNIDVVRAKAALSRAIYRLKIIASI